MLDDSATGRAARRQARLERDAMIRQERLTGKTLDVISGLFGVCHETIRKVCKGQAPLPASVVATNREKAAEAKRTARAERNHKIIEASQSGRSVPSIAREHGLRVQTVEAVLFKTPPGIDPKPRRGLPPTEAVLKRVRNVHLARQAGATYGQIEARFSLSPTKIRSILHPPPSAPIDIGAKAAKATPAKDVTQSPKQIGYARHPRTDWPTKHCRVCGHLIEAERFKAVGLRVRTCSPPCTPALARAKTRERVARLRIRRKLKAIRDAKAERDRETRIKVDFSYGSNPKAKKERAVRSKERKANSTSRPLRQASPGGYSDSVMAALSRLDDGAYRGEIVCED